MPITPSSGSLVIPAISEVVCDAFWLQQLVITAPSLTGKVEVSALLMPYDSSTGTMPPGNGITLRIGDVFAQVAKGDTSLANTVGVIFNEIQRQAQLQGLI
jgi:hypothetical protein